MHQGLFLLLTLTLLIPALANNTTNNIPIIVTDNKNYTTSQPTWLTSPYFRAGQQAVITTYTGSSQFPFASYTFTYSSALSGVPSLAYGIKKYRGDDYLGQEFYEIRQTGLTSSTFSVQIQIFGVTNLWLLEVAYLAVDPGFPHHLNSFDNVPINYTAGDIVNISYTSSNLNYYTNYINYTAQAAGRTFTSFTQPFSSNYIVIFITSLWIQGSFGTYVRYHIYPEVINQTHYMWNNTLEKSVRVTNVHFSQIIFNSDDVQSSKQYFIVFEKWYTGADGGFLQVPIQFLDNFIMAITSFETSDAACGFEYQWDFTNQTLNGTITFGVEILRSWTLTNTCGFSWGESSIFYMMTWQCDAPYLYFNLTSRLCQTQCGAFTVQNTTDYTCEPCVNTTCYQCNAIDPNICTDCASYLNRQLIAGQCVCSSGYLPANNDCLPCSSSQTGCILCDYNDNAGGTLPFNSSYFICTACNMSANYYLNQSQCLLCNATGYSLNLDNGQCEEICGDGILFQLPCDDGNLNDGDGCSSTCQIQDNYACTNGSSNSSSICSFNGNINLLFKSGTKDPTKNSLTLSYQIQPVGTLIDLNNGSVDFKALVSFPNNPGVTVTEAYVDPVTSQLIVKLDYSQDLQDQDLVLKVDPPNVPQAFAIPSMSVSWKVDPDNQLSAVVYSEDEYQQGKGLSIVANIIIGCFLSILFLTVAYRKWIGLELATLIQMGYLSLLMNKQITAYLQPIADLHYVFGYSQLHLSSVPNSFNSPYHIYSFQAHLGFSNNLMVLITLSLYLLSGLLLLVSFLTSEGHKKKLKKVAFVIADDLCYSLVVFITPSVLTALALQFQYGVFFDWQLPWSKLLLIACILMFFGAHALSIKTAQKSHQIGTFLQENKKPSTYMPVLFNTRLLLLTFFLFIFHLNTSAPSYLAIILQFAYGFYVIVGRPHLKLIDLVRSLVLQSGLLVILILRVMEINLLAQTVDPRSAWLPFVAYVEYLIYIAGIIVSYISSLYHIFSEIKTNSKKRGGNISKKFPGLNQTLEDLENEPPKQIQKNQASKNVSQLSKRSDRSIKALKST